MFRNEDISCASLAFQFLSIVERSGHTNSHVHVAPVAAAEQRGPLQAEHIPSHSPLLPIAWFSNLSVQENSLEGL